MGKIYKALEKTNSKKFDMGDDFDHGKNVDRPIVNTPVSDLEPQVSGDHATLIKETGSYMEIPDNIDPSLVTVFTPHSVESEQFRLLKNNILFPEKGTPPRCIMVTSPSTNEGKSFISANLAISIAQSIDEHVLLMDCDLRSPTIDKLFALKTSHGLSEYLSKARPLSSLLQKTFIKKLTILPSGAVPANPSELLSSEQMRRLIHEVKLRYSDRYIIIDTPPPYITSEGNALARQMDGIILVIRYGKTRMKDIQDIINIYGKEKIIGVVHNFAEKRPGYGYGYYKYGYGK